MQTNIRGPEIIKRPSEGGTSRNRIINKSPFSRGQNQYSTESNSTYSRAGSLRYLSFCACCRRSLPSWLFDSLMLLTSDDRVRGFAYRDCRECRENRRFVRSHELLEVAA